MVFTIIIDYYLHYLQSLCPMMYGSSSLSQIQGYNR